MKKTYTWINNLNSNLGTQERTIQTFRKHQKNREIFNWWVHEQNTILGSNKILNSNHRKQENEQQLYHSKNKHSKWNEFMVKKIGEITFGVELNGLEFSSQLLQKLLHSHAIRTISLAANSRKKLLIRSLKITTQRLLLYTKPSRYIDRSLIA